MDSPTVNEQIINLAIKLDKKELAEEYINKALKSNSENLNYFLNYLNFKTNSDFRNFIDIMNCNNKTALLEILRNDLKTQFPKSRIINRFELILTSGTDFEETFNNYLINNVKLNIPSIFKNVKFIYKHQTEKIQQIDNIIKQHLESIEKDKKLKPHLSNNENLNSPPCLIWIWYFASYHYDQLRNLELALDYINKAIDSTPTVVDFYVLKSKILKHGGILEESAKAYEKARKLDLGDRFLNAKFAKTQVRNGKTTESLETMKEFIRDPLSEENIEHTQCMWYESETGFAYLQQGHILKAHRLFKMLFTHFNTLIEDQFDFYNYCLRRFMVNDFANTIEFMDRILDNKYVYIALEAFEIILKYLKTNSETVQKKVKHNNFS